MKLAPAPVCWHCFAPMQLEWVEAAPWQGGGFYLVWRHRCDDGTVTTRVLVDDD